MLVLSFRKVSSLIMLLMAAMLLQACNHDEDEVLGDNVDLTDSYRVEYTSDMTAIMEGKSVFTLEVTDLSTGSLVPGLNISVMPMMTMVSGMMHDSPVSAVTDNGDGSYEVTVYYLMPSSMMNGTPMGDWDLQVMIGGMNGEVAHFYPDVMMAMGDSVKATLLGQSDMIAGMMMAENRKYFMFKQSLMGVTDNHSFGLFLAARESMMSHAAVYLGAVLNQGDINYELTVSSISVEVSTDATNWQAATGSGDGYWTVSGLSGLTNNVAGEIYVRLSVNGEQKTTNGLSPAGDGTNDYGVFTVTPGMSM